MRKLIDDIFISFNDLKDSKKNLTNPSIPILYLGDFPKYQKSKPKIITVGLNPSNNEFPLSSRFVRFTEVKNIDITSTLSEKEKSLYLLSLNNYFKNSPNNWFDSYDPILNGLNTSYYPNTSENNALHTNLCSPFATDIIWSKLKSSIQFTLSREGKEYWHRLVEILKPDLVLLSIAKKYLERITFKKIGWKRFTSITRKKDGSPRQKPYDIEVTETKIGDKSAFLVFGQAVQLPFGTISTDVKFQIGEDLIKLLN